MTFNRRALAEALFNSRLYALTLGNARPERLACLPPPPWPGDREKGAALLKREESSLNDEAFHRFDWLRDLRDLGPAAAPGARRLAGVWLNRFGSYGAEAWEPGLLGRRLANWVSDLEFLSEGAEPDFARRLLASLSRQARHLQRVASHPRDGLRRLEAIIGLAVASCALPGWEEKLDRSLELLRGELIRQLLPDGTHVSRSPTRHFLLLRDLADLAALLRGIGRPVVPFLATAIERMAAMLRYFRHGDGKLALFNDSNEGIRAALDLVLERCRAKGKLAGFASESGFQRLQAGRVLVLLDAGTPPPRGVDGGTHAGSLSFEMSVGRERLVVNCGTHPGPSASWRESGRLTAAHSTVTVEDTNSSVLAPGGGLERRATVHGQRSEADHSIWIDAGHDGYVPSFDITHHRRLYLAGSGDDLRGEDMLAGPAGRRFDARFHLHPQVTVQPQQRPGSFLLRLPSGSGWQFTADGGEVLLEDSVYMGQPGEVRRSRQLVIRGRTDADGARLRWAFARVSQG